MRRAIFALRRAAAALRIRFSVFVSKYRRLRSSNKCPDLLTSFLKRRIAIKRQARCHTNNKTVRLWQYSPPQALSVKISCSRTALNRLIITDNDGDIHAHRRARGERCNSRGHRGTESRAGEERRRGARLRAQSARASHGRGSGGEGGDEGVHDGRLGRRQGQRGKDVGRSG